MKPEQWWKTGGLCGVLYVVLFIVGFVLQGGGPSPDDSPAEIKQWFIDNDSMYMIGDIVFGIAFIFFFVPFIGLLSTYLGRHETDGAGWSRVILMYGGALLALGGSVSCIQGAIAYDAVNFADDGLLKFAIDATYYANVLILSYIAAGLVFTTSVIILRTGAFPKWLGYLGLVDVLLCLIGGLSVFSDDPMGALAGIGLLGLLGWAIFNVAMSFYMWTAKDVAVTAPEPVIV